MQHERSLVDSALKIDYAAEINLSGDAAVRLFKAAAERKIPPVELLADLVNIILRDDLVAAVLDTD